ncbi:MAG TPA: NrfD/PsrC family molybdoenzyme membrane anchor subunit [Gemmataceae bacterium]|nr:NrfD/PsrC family molybdoenzyme membrane anchor subunit [Gemmataceae bacterium]
MRTNPNVPPPSGYADQTVTKAPNWHTLVVFDVLLNNLSTGLFLVAAVAELIAPATFTAVATWAYPIALALLLADLACLVLDLGDPLRFHHMLRVFKPSSPMSLGTWRLTVYSLFLTVIVAVLVVVAVGWLRDDSAAAWWVRTLAVLAALPFAFGSAAYKGVLFSTSAQPGWKDARWLGAYLVNSAVMLGAGVLLVIAALTDQTTAGATLRSALGLLIVLNLLPLGLLVADAHPRLSRLYSRRELGVVGFLVLLIGVVIPASSLLAGGSAAVLVAVLSLVIASLGIRFAIVRLPHTAT